MIELFIKGEDELAEHMKHSITIGLEVAIDQMNKMHTPKTSGLKLLIVILSYKSDGREDRFHDYHNTYLETELN